MLCDPMDYSPPGSSVHGISQPRILEWVAICYSRRSSWPRNRTCVSHVSYIGRQILYPLSHLGSPVRIMLSLPFFSVISILWCCYYSSKTWLFNALATLCCLVGCERNSVLGTEKLVSVTAGGLVRKYTLSWPSPWLCHTFCVILVYPLRTF